MIKKTSRPSRAAARRKAGYDWLSKLRCPACGHGALAALAPRPGDWGAWGVPGLRCPKCRGTYPVEKGGILRMIPRGDYSRYAYWEKLHGGVAVGELAALYKKRFAFGDPFLLAYYAMPRLARRLGWKAEESLELGCQWGSNSLALRRLGVTETVWLLDISVTALKGSMAFFKFFGVTPYAMQAEIHRLPFKDASIDLTLSGGLYEHFVGDEQVQVVEENLRVSRRVLCQVPESSAAYWTFRRVYSAYKGGWPFGFEEPLSWGRLKALFARGPFRMAGRDWHDLVSAARMVVGDRRAWARVVTARPFFFYLFRHDAVIAVERTAPGGPASGA